MYIFLLAVLLLPVQIQATVFQIQPVAQQIKESDGIVIGHYLRKKFIRLESGSIATQMIFKMNQESGMQSETFGMDEIIVHYPGGKIGDEMVKVEGVPEFIPGEHVVLMIKNHKDRFWGMNLGFGTFKVINYGREKMIVNTLFPEKQNGGQMRFEDFVVNVKTIKGQGLKDVEGQLFPTKTGGLAEVRGPASEQAKNRIIASKTDEEENNEDTRLSTLWMVFVLALMGGIFRWMRQKEAK